MQPTRFAAKKIAGGVYLEFAPPTCAPNSCKAQLSVISGLYVPQKSASAGGGAKASRFKEGWRFIDQETPAQHSVCACVGATK